MSKLSKDEKRRYQIVSRIMGILMRIGNVCCWIGVVGVIMSAIAAAVIAPNIKIDSTNKEITLFDKTSSYTIKDRDFEFGDDESRVTVKNNTVTVSENGKEVVSVKLSDGSLNEIEKFIETDAPKILAVLPYVLFLTAIFVALMALTLGHGARVFKNIAKQDTPFTEENIERTEKSFKYMLASLVLAFVINFIMSLTTNFASTSSALGTSISGVLMLYVAIYILKAGYENVDKKAEKKEKAENK